jgi:hypothetical protein
MAEETINEMMLRVAGDFMRRSKAANAKGDALAAAHDVRGAELANDAAAKWGGYANYCAKGVMPIDPADPELALGWGKERARAIKENRFIHIGGGAERRAKRAD